MEIYRDLSRPAARSEPDTAVAKIGENKENIEQHDGSHQISNPSRSMSMAGRPRGLRERRASSPHQGEPRSMGEKGDPVEVSHRTVLEDVTHRYNSSSLDETVGSDEESMMDVSSQETTYSERPTSPQQSMRPFSSQPSRRGSGFTRNMR